MTIEANIKNYYEGLVVEEVARYEGINKIDSRYYDDIACVALNNLPARYYRHSVDIAFYMSAAEYKDIVKTVKKAVEEAAEFVINRSNLSSS